jgi:hypothetical protein
MKERKKKLFKLAEDTQHVVIVSIAIDFTQVENILVLTITIQL